MKKHDDETKKIAVKLNLDTRTVAPVAGERGFGEGLTLDSGRGSRNVTGSLKIKAQIARLRYQ